MKVMAVVAMLNFAIDCVQWAGGLGGQKLFFPETAWIWWPVAFSYVVGALIVALRGTG